MNFLKNLVLFVLLLFVLGSAGGYFFFKQKYKAPANQLQIADGNFEVPITWEADTTGNTVEPHAALLLPVTIPGCSKTFYMQFDLGAPYSLLYHGKLKSIAEKTSGINISKKEGSTYLYDFSFMIGEMPVKASEIKVIQHGNSVINWTDTVAIDIIGTIGSDLIENKVLVLNFPQALIRFSDEVPAGLAANTAFTALTFDERRVVLPVRINGQETKVLYDSGSSAYELITDKATWQKLAQKSANVLKSKSNSWGNMLTIHTVASDKTISFAEVALPLLEVHYIEGTTFIQRTLMQFSGMKGMIGNKLFLESVVVLDTQQRRFGIVKQN